MRAGFLAFVFLIASSPRAPEDEGCFDEHTLVTLADGSRMEVKRLTSSERVLDPTTKRGMRVARLVRGPEPFGRTIELATAEGSATFTEQHPIPTSTGVKAAKDVHVGDLVWNAEGKKREIVRRMDRAPDETRSVYNVEIDTASEDERDHHLLANGIVVGDWWMEKQRGRAVSVATR
ncbi:MAG TPA: Hint domain-containing protein [Labilithrix sp.]